MKLGLLIPTTSCGRSWKSARDTYFYNYTFKSFIDTNSNNLVLKYKEHLEHRELLKPISQFTFYLGIDRGDTVLDTDEFRAEINTLISKYENVSVSYLYSDNIKKGHLTAIWNMLFKTAYNDNCDYFFQCGDDIGFITNGWVNDSITTLQTNKNIGLTGPVNCNGNTSILTQSFVSRTHYDLFGYYFPEEITNWYCDDWINIVYRKLNSCFPLPNHKCINRGGIERYNIVHCRELCVQLADRDYTRVSPKFKNI